ncbi:MAG: GNAT family N-acetyltransferase [Akkermansiaceae bacterium]
MGEILVRKWQPGDDLSAITALLHRAYAELAEMGFRYTATWQDDEKTLQRLSRGMVFIAESDGQIVGTVTLYLPPCKSSCAWYDRPDVARFGQLAVDPEFQRRGIGSRLMDVVENETHAHGVPNLALDTAAGAHHLIALYQKRGFSIVSKADWKSTNYESVMMNLAFGDPKLR